MPTFQCPLCGNSSASSSLFKLHRLILRCNVCQLVYAAPDETINSSSYDECYYHGRVYADYLSDRNAIHRNASRILIQLEKRVKGRSLLDVGCATGFFLEAARTRGWLVHGLEVSEYAANYARQQLSLAVNTASIMSPPDDLPKFDVVSLWDTIEHLERPDVALTNIHQKLIKPGGLLALSTGDYGCLLRRLTQDKWRLFGDTTHNFFFDEQTLSRLLAETGFKVVWSSHHGKWVSWQMVLQQSGLPFAHKAQKWLMGIKFNPALYVNLGDVMTVFATPI